MASAIDSAVAMVNRITKIGAHDKAFDGSGSMHMMAKAADAINSRVVAAVEACRAVHQSTPSDRPLTSECASDLSLLTSWSC